MVNISLLDPKLMKQRRQIIEQAAGLISQKADVTFSEILEKTRVFTEIDGREIFLWNGKKFLVFYPMIFMDTDTFEEQKDFEIFI